MKKCKYNKHFSDMEQIVLRTIGYYFLDKKMDNTERENGQEGADYKKIYDAACTTVKSLGIHDIKFKKKLLSMHF